MVNKGLVGIVIVNWNNWEDTIECLDSLNNITYPDYSIFIIDNGSTNNSLSKLKESKPYRLKNSITLISLDKNIGFAGGSNCGIKKALDSGCEYVLLLNNDTVVKPDFLEELTKSFENSSQQCIVGGKIYYSNRTTIYFKGGELKWFTGGALHRGKGKPEITPEKGEIDVTFITGCMMLIHRDVIKKIGYFDERYFLYCEDTDYCARAIKENIKLVVNLSSIIYHKENSTVDGWTSNHIYYLIRNRILFLKKNSSYFFSRILFYSVSFSAGSLLIVQWLLNRRYDLIKSAFIGLYDGLCNRVGERRV